MGLMGEEAKQHAEATRRLGKWIRQVRESHGHTQESVAHAAGLAVSTCGRLERAFVAGRWVNPSIVSFLKVMIVLEVTPDEFTQLMGEVLDLRAKSEEG